MPPAGLQLSPKRKTVNDCPCHLRRWTTRTISARPPARPGGGPVVAILAALASLALGGSVAPADQVQIGIGGHYRIGHWTAVRWVGSEGQADESPSAYSVETVDGDGVRVVFDVGGLSSQQGGGFTYCVPGREAAPLIVRDGSEVVAATRFPERGRPHVAASMLPPDIPWVMSIGDPLGIETVGANELLGRDPQVAVAVPESAAALPDAPLGYDGLDLIVISGSGRELARELRGSQSEAIADWVRGGGRLLVGLGEDGVELLRAVPWLAELLPLGVAIPDVVPLDPAAFETFLSSQTRLGPLSGIALPLGSGTIVTGRTTRREPVSLAAEYPCGLGRLFVVAADLDRPPMNRWPDRQELILRITGQTLVPAETRAVGINRSTNYDDLAGQTRAALDRFDTRRGFAFSLVALVVLGLVAFIGPLDFWLVNRFWNRPRWGWITFPVVTIGLSAWLVYRSGPASETLPGNIDRGPGVAGAGVAGAGDGFEKNLLEIVDVDVSVGLARGFSWGQFYSHDARLSDFSVEPTAQLGDLAHSIDTLVTFPFGWPGREFGAIRLAGEETRMPAYRVTGSEGVTGAKGVAGSEGVAVAAGGSALPIRFRSAIFGLPLAPRSSKSVATRYRFRPRVRDDVAVARRRGSELLEGRLANPLAVDLLDGMLIYRDWAYLLPTRFPANATIASVGDLRQKNFRWHLTRQRAIEQSIESQAWDAGAHDDLGRIAEMLMFHRAAGGARYTTLGHGPLGFLDLSPLLTEDRCVLVGRLAEPLTRFSFDAPAGSTTEATMAGHEPSGGDPAGRGISLVRVLLPVESPTPAR